ncbi:MAG: hypothetical protein OEQ39_12465 [Gammaproteobacteria bacterium]|nr:hypothetical protein [Gammaproteobacteria bacterium]
MTSESAEILAAALEADADAQERGETDNIGMKWDDVYGQILPINEIPDELFGLAMRFWDDWGDASRHDWQYHDPFEKEDWPMMSRKIAMHVRAGTLLTDDTILAHFKSKPSRPLMERLRSWFHRNA